MTHWASAGSSSVLCTHNINELKFCYTIVVLDESHEGFRTRGYLSSHIKNGDHDVSPVGVCSRATTIS